MIIPIPMMYGGMGQPTATEARFIGLWLLAAFFIVPAMGYAWAHVRGNKSYDIETAMGAFTAFIFATIFVGALGLAMGWWR
jgi:hypothetical protein